MAMSNKERKMKRFYLNNPNLKKIGVIQQLTAIQLQEYRKCAIDPIYFIEKYVKIISVDRGFIPIKLHPFQKNAIEVFHKEREVIFKAGRQIGKTTITVGYLLWYVLFNADKTVAVLANKASTSREILSRFKMAYEAFPLWIQQGVNAWNKGDIGLENKSRILATSTASTAIRGFSINLLYLDEFSFVPTNIAEDFFTSVYPTISSGETTKLIISSTPNGMNHFYARWVDTIEKRNSMVAIEANWRDVPGRTQEWADRQRAALGEQKYLQEVECEFIGSAGTLISINALKKMTFVKPVHDSTMDGFSLYHAPTKDRSYVLIADTSRGKGLDYSAFIVIDITEMPYKLVATYRDNDISPLMYPSIIRKVAEYYNKAFVMVEINDNGQQVVDGLFDDYDYENILSTELISKKMTLTWGSGNKSNKGIRTTKSVKRLGCSLIKNIIERDQILIEDYHVLSELSTFIATGISYEAAEGSHDDLVMCLVLFGWMTSQMFFKELTTTNIKERLHKQQSELIENETLPVFFGEQFGIDSDKAFYSEGSIWTVVN